ncbi:hypothetical protein Tco_0278382 [Tanacetum coccineum]
MTVRVLQSAINATNMVTSPAVTVGGHFQKDCPRLKNNKGNRGNQAGNDRAPAKVYVVVNRTMSSPNHSTSDIEDVFSSMNILNYTSVSSDYFPALSESSYFNSSKNSTDNIIPLVFSSFYNNPCLKDVQAFYAKELPISSPDPITPPTILTPSPVLPPSLLFDPRYFFVPEELLPPKKRICSPSSSSTTYLYLKHHEEQVEDILNYLEELSFHRIEKMEEGRINRMITQRNSNELKIKLERVRSQIIKLQRKKLGQKDKIAFAHYRISDLERIIEKIQARHQTDQEDL